MDQIQAISTDHSSHGPFHSQTIPFMDHSIHGPFHLWTTVKLSPQTIPFIDHSIYGLKSNYLHRPFHSRTKFKLHVSPRTIPFTDHSNHEPNSNYLRRLFPSRTISFTDHLQIKVRRTAKSGYDTIKYHTLFRIKHGKVTKIQ